jgi:polysaccharide chain length determinant protein (PEP-CTERM system associated)
MVRDGQISLADAKRVLRRYWWILLITIPACVVAAAVAVKVLPKKYTSQTVVLVDAPAISADIVKPVVPENLGLQLASMQQQILSRTRLEPVIEKFGLYQRERKKHTIDELVVRLRDSIEVVPMEPMAGTANGNRQLPGFTVKVTFDNPVAAQQICTEVTSMFTVESASASVAQGKQATSFLTQELDEAKAKLDAEDGRLAQFKGRYIGSLPDDEQRNLTLLAGANTQLEAVTQALGRAQQEKAFDETLLSQQEASWHASQSGQNPETDDQQLVVLQDQLAALRSKYTDEHPDVVKLKARIADLKNKIATAPPVEEKKQKGGAVASTEPLQLQQLRAKLHQDQLNAADLTKQQAQMQQQIHALEGRIQSSPLVEQQYKELTRNHQTALDLYNSLLKNREQAAMATNLQQQQEGEQFRMLDPASLPNKPSFPSVTLFLGGGAGAGFALGLGILFLLAVSDKSLHTQRDVETYLKIPVLAAVPLFDTFGQNKSRASGNKPRPDPGRTRGLSAGDSVPAEGKA